MSKASRPPSRRLSPRARAWSAVAVVLLLAAGLYVGMYAGRVPERPDLSTVLSPQSDRPSARDAGQPHSLAPSEDRSSDPEEYGDQAPMAEEAARQATEPVALRRQPPPPHGPRPRVAVVIDDLGRSVRDVATLGALGVELSYAVLPFESRTAEVVAELRRRNAEILCHLPMEAKGLANPGPGALLMDMNQEQISEATRRALAAVPGAVGVNNHMGSGITAKQEAIAAVLQVVSERRLFYLDSRTSADTVAYSLARSLGVPAGERQVFLDTKRDREYIRGQFQHLLEVAQQRGGAIAIGHPYPETLEILAEEVPRALAMGVEFVRASSLIDS